MATESKNKQSARSNKICVNTVVVAESVVSPSSPIPQTNRRVLSHLNVVVACGASAAAGGAGEDDPSESSSTTNTWNSRHESNNNNNNNNNNANHNEDNRTATSSHTAGSRRSRAYSIASLPSIFTADPESVSDHDDDHYDEGGHLENHPSENDGDDDENNAGASASVSTDQERQILLLMLLAQVCALHDATPRTFTVHVLELFERGILNRDSIHFLFELGLVPSISPTHKLLANSSSNTTTTTTTGVDENCDGAMPTVVNDSEKRQQLQQQQQLALSKSIVPRRVMLQQQRSQEASAIRLLLEAQEQQQQQKELQRKKRQKGKQQPDDANHDNGTDDQNTASTATTPWEVEHFPLSLSRYQREFHQIEIISAGAFGQVFHVSRKMDGCDYAIKKVTFDATGYSDSAIDQVVREVQCLAKVNDHPNIVRYFTSWLEPGWMTGGSGGAATNLDDENRASNTTTPAPIQPQQHQLVADLQQLLQTQHNDRDRNNHSYVTKDDMELSSFGGGDRSRSRSRQQRRFSFGGSVESIDQSWDASWEHMHVNNDWSLGNKSLGQRRRYGNVGAGGRRSFDDSYISTDSPSNGRHDDFSRSNAYPPKRKSSNKTGRHQSSPQQKHQRNQGYRYEICLFIQMQLCHPATLADYIRERNRQIPESDHDRRIGPALDIFRQIASGLAHVHTNGIIHRDLKPANIFASKDGMSIKIGDFGLSKCTALSSPAAAAADHFLPQQVPNAPSTMATGGSSHHHHHHEYWQDPMHHGSIVVPKLNSKLVLGYGNGAARAPAMDDPLTVGIGTASYASPEQVKSRSYGTKADIFSLGLILLELLCCFETEHERYHNFQQCRQKRILPEWITNQFPTVAAVILSCTQEDPRLRPTAKELLQAIPVPVADRSSPQDGSDHVPQSNTTALAPYHPPEMNLPDQEQSLGVHRPLGPRESAGLATTSILQRPIGFSPAMIKDVVLDKLQCQLAKKEEQLQQQQDDLAEKDRIIESMRVELERMQSGKDSQNGDGTMDSQRLSPR